jgi:Tol biopolymer transport system component
MKNHGRLRKCLIILALIGSVGFHPSKSSLAVENKPEGYSFNQIERISLASDGLQLAEKSNQPSLSLDGQRAVYHTEADIIYLYDSQTKENSIIANGENSSISPDGLYAVYDRESCSGTFTYQICTSYIMRYDIEAEQKLTVASETLSTYTDYAVSDPSVASGGRYVVYMRQTYNHSAIFLRDTQLETTIEVSISSDGTEGNDYSRNPSISADGRFITFQSQATNLVPDDTNGVTDIFRHDTQTGNTIRVSVSSTGEEGNDVSSSPSISSDGRYVAFASTAANLVPDDTNAQNDIFVHDTQTGTTIRVSVASDGTQGEAASSSASLSGDGQSVAFSSAASNLVSDDENGLNDIFIHDLQSGITSLASSDNLGNQANGASTTPAISGDGQYVTFTSTADNLVNGDTNGVADVFLREQASTEITFNDVFPSHWAFDWIEAIASAGLSSGYPDGTYRPGNPVTRAEMAVFLLNGMGVSVPPIDGSSPFSDINGHWAEAYIEELYDQGITGGYPNGTYRPDNLVTRAEMAVFLLNALSVSPPAIDSSHPFSDVSGHWAEIFIEELYDQGITGGYPDGTYRPENRVTRAEMAVFLVNAFGLSLP